MVLDLPRAARLALWGTAAVRGHVRQQTALDAVQRDDEPHTVSGATAASTLAELLEALAAGGRGSGTALRLVLPAPGDPSGLAGPAELTTAAVDAGSAVVVERVEPDGRAGAGPTAAGSLSAGPLSAGPLGLVPDVTEFGSELEPGAMVDWRVHAAQPSRPPTESLADADRALREALLTTTQVLADLDVSRWREDAADRIVAVRDSGLGPTALPPGTDPRVARVVATAVRVRAIVELALDDDGASVTGWEATMRARALRDVDGVARRCLAAAVSAQVLSAP